MSKARVFVSAFFLLLALEPHQFAQDAPTSAKNPNAERQGVMLGLVRTINTIQVTEVNDYGSYAPWPILLAHHQEDFNGWLKRFYSSGEPNTQNLRFTDMPEILPGYSLRLNVHADGQGYDLRLEDTAAKKWSYAAFSDESGVIWQGEPLH
jgi:hypothetical protein